MTAVAALTLALAVVYVLGGVAKAKCPRLLAGTLLSLGAPRRVARAVSHGLPVLEVAGGLLVVLTSGWIRGTALTALAVVLVGGIAAAWHSRGRAVPCACLGPGDPATLGAETWVRNMGLLAAGAVVALDAGPSALTVATASDRGAVGALLVVAATALALHLQLGVGRQRATLEHLPAVLHAAQQTTVHRALEAPRLPRLVANLQVHDVDGRPGDLRTLTDQRPQLLIVTEPDCPGCALVVPHIPAMQTRMGDLADVRAVSLEPLCSHPAPDELPAGSVFVADGIVGRMWSTGVLPQGTPALCVVDEGLLLRHDALSDLSDLDALAAELSGP